MYAPILVYCHLFNIISTITFTNNHFCFWFFRSRYNTARNPSNMRFTSVVSCFPFIRISYTTTTHIFLDFFLQYLFVSHLVFVYIPYYIVWYIVLFVLGLCVSFYFMYIWGVILCTVSCHTYPFFFWSRFKIYFSWHDYSTNKIIERCLWCVLSCCQFYQLKTVFNHPCYIIKFS